MQAPVQEETFCQRLIAAAAIRPDKVAMMLIGPEGRRTGAVGQCKDQWSATTNGQRSFDGQLHEFKKGASILATELKLPIVPVALDGTYRI